MVDKESTHPITSGSKKNTVKRGKLSNIQRLEAKIHLKAPMIEAHEGARNMILLRNIGKDKYLSLKNQAL